VHGQRSGIGHRSRLPLTASRRPFSGTGQARVRYTPDSRQTGAKAMYIGIGGLILLIILLIILF